LSKSGARLPLRITLVLWLVLITSAWNVIRVWGGLSLHGVLDKYVGWSEEAYICLTGAFWAATGLLILGAFWRRAWWADRLLLAAALGYSGWLWFDRLLVAASVPANWPFALAINGTLLAVTAVVSVDRRNRYYLRREAHEREEQDRQTA